MGMRILNVVPRSHFGVKVDRPSMTFHDDGPGDGQSLSRAAAHLLGRKEGIEHLFANGLGNAGAVVLTSISTAVSVPAGADGDRSPLARPAAGAGFDGVRGVDDQVQEDLVQVARPACYAGASRRPGR